MLVPACRSCCCLHRVHLQEEWGQVACSNKLARHLLTTTTQDEKFGRSEESEPFSAPGAPPMSRCRNCWFLRNFFDAARRPHRGRTKLAIFFILNSDLMDSKRKWSKRGVDQNRRQSVHKHRKPVRNTHTELGANRRIQRDIAHRAARHRKLKPRN